MRQHGPVVRGIVAAVVATAIGCAGPAARDREPLVPAGTTPSWSMEGGGPGRASTVDRPVPGAWQLRTLTPLVQREVGGGEEYATPVVVGDLAFVGHSGRSFDAVWFRRAEIAWRVPVKGRVAGTAAWSDGILVFGDDEGLVRAVDTAGSERWTFKVDYPVVSSPVAASGRVFVPVSDQNVFALEAATGRPLWQYGRRFPRSGALWRALGLSSGQGRVYAGFSDGMVVALDAEVGSVVWQAEVGRNRVFGDISVGPVYRDGRVFVGAAAGPLARLDANTGEIQWKIDLEAVSGPAVGERFLVVGLASGEVVAVSVANGGELWRRKLDGGIPTRPVLADGAVVVGASDGSVYALDPVTGRVLHRYLPGPGLHGQPVVLDDGILLLSDGGSLHWIR